MEDQLISFKTAKLAKEKGFNWPTLYYHSTNRGDRSADDIKRGYTGSGMPANDWNKSIDDHISGIDLYSAPILSSLQKWFREVHKIHINIYVNGDNEGNEDVKWSYTYNVRYDNSLHDDAYYYIDDETFETYEEALKKGLLELFKLIDNN